MRCPLATRKMLKPRLSGSNPVRHSISTPRSLGRRVGLERMRERDPRSTAFIVGKVLRSDASLQKRRAEQSRAERENYGTLKEPHASHDKLRLRVDDYPRNGWGRQLEWENIHRLHRLEKELAKKGAKAETAKRLPPQSPYPSVPFCASCALVLLFCVICG